MSWAMSEPLAADQDPRLIPEDTFAARLVLLRHELRLTVDEISSRCGVASATWSTWERGTRPRDLVSVVTRIAEATGYDRDWLMWGFPLRAQSELWEVLEGFGPAAQPELPFRGHLAVV